MNICRFVQNRILEKSEGTQYPLISTFVGYHCKKCQDCRRFARTYNQLFQETSYYNPGPPPSGLKESCLEIAGEKQRIIRGIYRQRVRSLRYATGLALVFLIFSLPFIRNTIREQEIYYNDYHVQESLYYEYDEEFDSDMAYVYQLISFLDEEDNGFM